MTQKKSAVTGLVLSIGEPTTARAIESLRAQTFPCEDIVLIENVSPFHAAMNAGITRISSPLFIQCDADMIVDPDCVETLLSHFHDDVGVAIGYLEDAILGQVQAIKMFRTECFKALKFFNHISPDTNIIYQIVRNGWNFVFAERSETRFGHPRHVLGKHDPDYTPLYTFNKFKLVGARMRERGVFAEFLDAHKKLAQNTHPMAMTAIIGLCHGIFLQNEKDGLHPFKMDRDFKLLDRYMNSTNQAADFIMTSLEKESAVSSR